MPQAAGIGCVARTEAASFGVFPWPEKQEYSKHTKKCILVNCKRWLKGMHANYSKQKTYAMS